MAIMKCKMCGGDLNVAPGETIAECEYCGTRQTVPSMDNEKKMNLFARANRLRFAGEFDKAAGIYESIVADFPEEAEAYWGLVLCKYGVEYVDDPAGKKVVTCHRSSFSSVMDDANLELALEYADPMSRRLYREEAIALEELRKGIIEVSGKEEPYDIFICYKETAGSGERTLDSVLAQDVYDALTDKGYRVFFSRVSLEDKLGQEYEPYIFAALNSAKVMLAFGTDYEYFNAVWVKNEWSRFLQLMNQDKSKHLIPCFKGITAYDMPREFTRLQAQDLGKVGAVQDLLRGIEKLLPRGKQPPVTPAEPQPVAQAAPQPAAPAMPKKSRGKVIALVAALCVAAVAAVVLGAGLLSGKAPSITPEESKYAQAQDLLKGGRYIEAAELFGALGAYEDSRQQTTACMEAAYQAAGKQLEAGNAAEAQTLFTALGDYKDSASKLEECGKSLDYEKARALMEQGSYKEATAILEGLEDYKDSGELLASCQTYGSYQEACQLAEAGAYQEAVTRFTELGDFQDAQALVEKYRWYAYEVGDLLPFGEWWQEDPEPEPIWWRVLAKKDEKLLVVSTSILDVQPYNTSMDLVGWGNCSLRVWLNTTFYDVALGTADRSRIVCTETILPGDEFDSVGDLVFLLSYQEAETYFYSSLERQAFGTTYAREHGLYYDPDTQWDAGSYWWLRDQQYVDPNGGFPSRYDAPADSTDIGVRPAMWLSIEGESGGGTFIMPETTQPPLSTEYTMLRENQEGLFLVDVKNPDLPIYTGPGYGYDMKHAMGTAGTYTIVAEAQDSYGTIWGLLKSGSGWIDLTGIDRQELPQNDPAPEGALLTVDPVPDSMVNAGYEVLYCEELSEYGRYLLIFPEVELKSILIVREDAYTGGDGPIKGQKLNIRAKSPFLIYVEFPDVCGYWLYVTDTEGVMHRYYLQESGEDGSILLREFD